MYTRKNITGYYSLVGSTTALNNPVTTLLTWQNRISKITVLLNHGESTGVVRVCQNMQNTTWYNNQLFNLVISFISLSSFDNLYEDGCWFIVMVPTTLFKSILSSSHEQSVPTCMNKSVDNTVQAGQLNHVQACQQAKTSCAFLRVYQMLITSVFRYV